MYKVGDLVVYLKHFDTYIHFDKQFFTIGKVYVVGEVDNEFIDIINPLLYGKVHITQIQKVYELNPINKLLYPDYEIFTYNEKKYLKPKEM